MSSGPRIILNPIRPGGGGIGVGGTKPTHPAKLPSVKTLKNVLGAWKFQSPGHEIQWKTKKPAGAVAGKVVVQKAPKDKPGTEIIAYVLKSDPTKVYFSSQNKGFRMPPSRPGLIMNPPPPSFFEPKYFGPVSTVALPK
jgi:hypothetical protein